MLLNSFCLFISHLNNYVLIKITFMIIIVILVIRIDFVGKACRWLLKSVLLHFDLLVVVKIIVLDQIHFFVPVYGKIPVNEGCVSIFSCVLVCHCRWNVTTLVFVYFSYLIGYELFKLQVSVFLDGMKALDVRLF